MVEEWRDISGYEGAYRVSNLGNVFSVRKGGNLRFGNVCGYSCVSLSKNGKCKSYRVHRLVAEAFLDPIYAEVDHINSVRSDNRLSNLRLCTRRENMIFHYKKEHVGVCRRKIRLAP